MPLHEQIKNELKTALKERDTARLGVLRNMIAELTNELVAQKRTPQEVLDDADVIKTIKRLIKQRKDSIEQFSEHNRTDLVAGEKEELAILKEYVPEELSTEKIREVVQKHCTSCDASGMEDMGTVMSAVMQDIGDQADGTTVRTIVEDELRDRVDV